MVSASDGRRVRRCGVSFRIAGRRGHIEVECRPNTAPAELGCPAGARDLPVCTATVRLPPLGYRGLTGWVQVVRSSDNPTKGAAFDVDPFALFADVSTPYCWYGTNPTLFDAPSRRSRADLEWEAHSFLAMSPLDGARNRRPRVVPLAGFTWGFEIRDGEVTIVAPRRLALAQWNNHLRLLRSSYARWAFEAHA